MAAATKVVKSGKTEKTPGVEHITLRGVAYTITEIDVNVYDELIEQLADPNGAVRFDKLLRAMVTACVRPLPSKPWPFAVYRTLEGIVNDMHYTDLKDEAATAEADAEGDGETGETEPAEEGETPNS